MSEEDRAFLRDVFTQWMIASKLGVARSDEFEFEEDVVTRFNLLCRDHYEEYKQIWDELAPIYGANDTSDWKETPPE